MPKEWVIYYRGARWFGQKPGSFVPMGRGVFFVLTGNGSFGMRYRPFRGIQRAAWFAPGRPLDAALLVADRIWLEVGVKKVTVAERSSVKHLAALESQMFREHLAVLEVLAMLQYADGSPREPGYLGMWTQGGTWFVRVQDKTGDAQMTAEGRTAEEAWDALALLLGSENPPWEPMSRRRKKGS